MLIFFFFIVSFVLTISYPYQVVFLKVIFIFI